MKAVFLFSGAVLFLSLSSCGGKDEQANPVVQDISESVYASGVIKAVNQYEVFSTTNGILSEIYVEEGDTVQSGTPLFKIDNTISVLSAENARLSMEQLKERSSGSSATLADLESKMMLAKEKFINDSVLFKRQQILWDQNIGSKLDLEKRELAFKSSKTEFHSASLQYELVKSDLEREYAQSKNNFLINQKRQNDFVITSKLNGVIFSVNKETGEYISTLTPIAIVGEASEFEIEMQVDEFDIVRIKNGQKVFISMDSYRGKVFEGVIKKIEPFMNERTRTFKVLADFTKAPDILYPNLSLEANVLIALKKNALTIPAGYLIDDNKVLISDNDTVTVTVGIANLQWVEIVDGLSEGQTVFKPSR